MPSTTNFGWTTPADTDLVKDGASAIRTLANGIDTTLVDLKGGTTGQVLSKNSNTDMDFTWSSVDPLTILDAKGDLISATAADTPARLAVGTNGQVLTADSTQSTGLAWTTIAAGGFTSLATGTLSTNQVTISSISGSYVDLYLLINAPIASASDNLGYRFNGNTSSSYAQIRMRTNSATLGQEGAQSNIYVGFGVQTTNNYQSYFLRLPNYAASTSYHQALYGANDDFKAEWNCGFIPVNGAINSISIRLINGTATFSAGTYTLYGVK